MRISDWSSDVCSSDLVGLALTDHVARLLAAGLAVDLGAAMLVFGFQGQPIDAFGGADRGGGQTGKGLQGAQVDGLEAFRVQRVEGQQAPRLLVDEQWADRKSTRLNSSH